MHSRANALRTAGTHVIDFSIAVSHFPAPARVLRSVAAEIQRQEVMPYTDVIGAQAVRSTLCAKLRNENGIEATPGEVLVTNGVKQAFYQALYVLTDPGDSIIVFLPYWPAYLATAQLLGLRVIFGNVESELTERSLDALGPARVIILNNPHNPSGKVYTVHELEAVRDWARRTGCQVIVDESYEHLVFEGRHTSLAALSDWRNLGVVTLFSASQSYAMMGWRVGFAVAPKAFVSAMQNLQGPITAAVGHLSQIAASAAFSNGRPFGMLDDYRERRDFVLDKMRDVPWIEMTCPDAGPYLWGDIRSLTLDSARFANALLDVEKVALMPGEALGCAGFIRIGYISDDFETLQEGIQRVIEFGSRYEEWATNDPSSDSP
ncbi:pyridoxal phosphate-dependent aminotransferase [Massilia sp. KIM]|uniref:pyridoxal phosphate-dependent aminotransferase n=1 Tax=Massilia sp. KIM TaxID=1955422 RepID=UPI0022770E0E|nr:aminotransferase class I/II-fold pyridoxal phosphate-dependent enzyme [Massilia sp. KIM]